MLNKISKWFSKDYHLSLAALIISLIALGVQLFFLPYQIDSYKLDKKYKELDATFKSVDILKKYDDDLNSGTNEQIVNALNNNEPIFKETGGKFNSNQIDKFLGIFNTVYDLYGKDLVSSDDIASQFSDTIDKANKNIEIQNYLKKIRMEDPAYFMGFDYLQEEFGTK